ncbi:MAG: hypothetical protein Q8O14_09675 [bacterium]|nr:hypothetical protein [bacterium]
MTACDQRERQVRLAGWGTSGAFMLVLWLILAQLSVDRPRQSAPPTEEMLSWVRTIIPTPARDQVMRQRVRERLERQLTRVAPRPLTEPERALVRPRPDFGGERTGGVERRALDLPSLPGREGVRGLRLERESGGRALAPEREGLRGGGGLDLRTEAVERPQVRVAAGAGPRERALAMPRQGLDPVLANFLGCPSRDLPGAMLALAGGSWQAWFCGEGGGLRVLLRQGDDLRLLVLTGADLHLQGFQRGTVSRGRGDLIVQSERARAGEGTGLRDGLLEALEEWR